MNEGEKHNGNDVADAEFRCPCGDCSLESYLDNGCPKSEPNSFPFLDLAKLDKNDRTDLHFKLSQDVKNIKKSFAELIYNICMSIESRGVDVDKLALCALSFGAYESRENQKPLLGEDEKELMSSTRIVQAFLVIRRHISFYNHELLKHITDNHDLCSDDDRKQMTDYCHEFRQFCQRKVFEVPSGTFKQDTAKSKKRKSFVVIMTKHEADPNLEFVNEAKVQIALILQLKPSTLRLEQIDPGCLMLVFSVPTFVARKLFPLSPSTQAKLEAEGLLVLQSTIESAQKGKNCG